MHRPLTGSDRIGCPDLPQILEALAGQGFTVAILDTAGVASTGGNLAMQAADLALIPARPSRLDLQATMPTIETLMRLGMRDRFAFVLNQCPAGRSGSNRRGGQRARHVRRAGRAGADATGGPSRRVGGREGRHGVRT
ncbi:hypothetical protein ACU4GR_13230 [Methylobacterium oryzae CBMB20]